MKVQLKIKQTGLILCYLKILLFRDILLYSLFVSSDAVNIFCSTPQPRAPEKLFLYCWKFFQQLLSRSSFQNFNQTIYRPSSQINYRVKMIGVESNRITFNFIYSHNFLHHVFARISKDFNVKDIMGIFFLERYVNPYPYLCMSITN